MMTRLSDALVIRDHAMTILAKRGKRVVISGLPTTEAHLIRAGMWVSLLLNEGKDLKNVDPRLLYSDPSLAPEKEDDHALFIFAPRSVFHLRWNDDGSKPHLAGFKRGPWEAAFAAPGDSRGDMWSGTAELATLSRRSDVSPVNVGRSVGRLAFPLVADKGTA